MSTAHRLSVYALFVALLVSMAAAAPILWTLDLASTVPPPVDAPCRCGGRCCR